MWQGVLKGYRDACQKQYGGVHTRATCSDMKDQRRIAFQVKSSQRQQDETRKRVPLKCMSIHTYFDVFRITADNATGCSYK